MARENLKRPQNADIALPVLNGTPVWLCSIVVATTGTPLSNLTTATPYTFKGGEVLRLQPSTACYVEFLPATGSATAGGAKSIMLEAGVLSDPFVLPGSGASVYRIFVEPVVAAPVTCKVFELL